MNQNLIVVRAGVNSLHPQWFGQKGLIDFDLCVSAYGEAKEGAFPHASFMHYFDGPVWAGNDDACKMHTAVIKSYDYVAFADDDLMATTETWSRLFGICKEYRLDLAHPALTVNTTRELTRQAGLLRYTDRVDLMCPVFSKRALAKLMPTFEESSSGWGLQFLWSHLCPHPEYKTAIVDATPVEHTRPFGHGDLYQNMRKLGVDPRMEQLNVVRKYRLRQTRQQFFEQVPLRR